MEGRAGHASDRLFHLERRLDALSAKDDPLERIKTTVPWETFRTDIEAVSPSAQEQRRPQALQCDFEFEMLQSLYILSDEQTEFQIRGRLSMYALPRPGTGGRRAGRHTVWLLREASSRSS